MSTMAEQQEVPAPAQAKKKYDNIAWEQNKVFENNEQQNAFFAANPQYKKFREGRSDTTGHKQVIYCNAASHKGPVCPVQLMLHYLDHRTTSILYSNGKQHVHDAEDQIPTKVPISVQTKEKIKKMLDDKVRPRLMYMNLQKDADIKIKPTHNQVWEIAQIILVFFKVEMSVQWLF